MPQRFDDRPRPECVVFGGEEIGLLAGFEVLDEYDLRPRRRRVFLVGAVGGASVADAGVDEFTAEQSGAGGVEHGLLPGKAACGDVDQYWSSIAHSWMSR